MKISITSKDVLLKLLSPSRDAIDDIKEVISSLIDDDYRDFTTSHARDIAIAYVKNKPVAFSFTRDYDIEDNELGVVLSTATDPEYRGRGYSKRLSQLVITKSLNDPEISEICWAADIDNEGSVAVAKSLGFEHWYDYEDTTVYKYPER